MKLNFVFDDNQELRGVFISPRNAGEYAITMKNSIDMDYLVMPQDVWEKVY